MLHQILKCGFRVSEPDKKEPGIELESWIFVNLGTRHKPGNEQICS